MKELIFSKQVIQEEVACEVNTLACIAKALALETNSVQRLTELRQMESLCSINTLARQGNINYLKRLIQDGNCVDNFDNRGWRATHEAAAGNHVECLKALLQQKATNLNWTSFDGMTAVSTAAQFASYDCVRLMIDSGADLDLPDCMNKTPLMNAVKSGDVQCVEALIKGGANVNAQMYCDTTALHLAVSLDRPDIVKILLNNAADVALPEDFNITPVYSSSQFGHVECLVELLAKAKEKGQLNVVNVAADDGGLPLLIAAQEGHSKCIQLLIQHDADANIPFGFHLYLPLHWAVKHGQLECVKLLLPATNLNVPRCHHGVWQLAFQHDGASVLELLYRLEVPRNYYHGVNVDRAGAERVGENEVSYPLPLYVQEMVTFGREASLLAGFVLSGSPSRSCLQFLLDNEKADGHDWFEVSPAYLAVSHNAIDTLDSLVQHGASLDVYHPVIVGNLVVLASFGSSSRPNIVEYLGKCGAEMKSLFSRDKLSWNRKFSGRKESSSGVVPTSTTLYDVLHKNASLNRGNILYQLLRFVDRAWLDTRFRNMMKDQQWNALRAITTSPRSLSHLTRCVIRWQFSHEQLHRQAVLETLPLPTPLKDFILYK